MSNESLPTQLSDDGVDAGDPDLINSPPLMVIGVEGVWSRFCPKTLLI